MGGTNQAPNVPEEPVEIERKFLLRERPQIPNGAEILEIEQGYLPPPSDADAGGAAEEEHVEGRLRRAVHADGTEQLIHTIKRGHGTKRTEIERLLTPADFQRYWPATAGRRLSKRRYRVTDPDGRMDLVWEIDEFTDRDLWLAEVELPSEETQIVFPAWLRGSVVREVTDEARFTNYALAARNASNAV